MPGHEKEIVTEREFRRLYHALRRSGGIDSWWRAVEQTLESCALNVHLLVTEPTPTRKKPREHGVFPAHPEGLEPPTS